MAATLGSKTKDPSARKDYSVDWTAWMTAGDSISAVAWTVAAGITSNTPSNSTTVATLWFEGGTARTNYTVTCRITTAEGRVDERTFTIKVRDL